MSFTRRFLDPPEPDTHPFCNTCEDEICDGVNPCQRVVDAMEANEKAICEHEDKFMDERLGIEIRSSNALGLGEALLVSPDAINEKGEVDLDKVVLIKNLEEAKP